MVKVGDKAPDFEMYDTNRKPRSLRDFIGKKTVLLFYPAAFTGVCTREMCTFRDSLARFNDVDAQVVGISIDSPFSNKAFAEKYNLQFPLLSDFSKKVSVQYGGGLVENLGGVLGYTASKRSVFVLDKEGIVRYAWISDDPGVEPKYEEILRAVSSLN
ncbi:MAG TPA: peroxiredoxin [Bacteroidota bacterium]|nr:peroxiredoxin [Bacteroidota bacterium]